MSLRVAMIADDLTGALDTSVAFAVHGFTTRVAVTPAAIAAALRDDPEVLAINTASRALPPEAAAAVVREATRMVSAARPAIRFKKIDSRLKGNVAAETAAMAGVLGARRLLVAPAVPDQQRVVRGGRIAGRGVEAPLPVAPLFDGLGLDVSVADAETRGDLDAVISGGPPPDVLLVGASGLGQAIARALGGRTYRYSFQPAADTLFAFGSRDPITRDQLDTLILTYPELAVADLPAGRPPAIAPARLPALLQCTGEVIEPASAVARRFAETVAAAVAQLRPATLVIGGGDTALAVLERLGAEVLAPVGEPVLGMVDVSVALPGGALRCLVKSGGFGNVDALVGLIESGPVARAAGQ